MLGDCAHSLSVGNPFSEWFEPPVVVVGERVDFFSEGLPFAQDGSFLVSEIVAFDECVEIALFEPLQAGIEAFGACPVFD
ncbi:MAG TPA: hypothetical protein VFQ72_04140 [Candidatus Paceibacterota bacterium]|nr:hypothetical protein [Candidatus Paceibacterota bacterium]